MRVKPLLLLLTLSGCVSPGRAGAGQEQEPWRRDWRAFWEAVEPYARAGMIEHDRDANAFNQVFGGEVEWYGTLRSMRSYPGAGVRVELDMPPVLVPLQDGSSIQVRELTLSCSARESGCERWSTELIGREVRFRTDLQNRTRGNQPVVRVRRVGKQPRIHIHAYGAELVGAASQ